MTQHAAPTIQELQQLDLRARCQLLLARDEDQYFDRKSNRIGAPDLADALVAFANAEGGLIAVGFSSGLLDGVDGVTARVNDWTQAGADFTDPTVPTHLIQLECEDAKGARHYVALIEVTSGGFHKNRKGEVLLRVGDENRRLSPNQAMELSYAKGTKLFDGTPAIGTAVGDLDMNRVSTWTAELPGASNPTDALRARGLLTTRNGDFVPTVAAILLFGRTPAAHLQQARVRVLQYNSPIRETGTNMNITDDITFDGTLPEQIEAAWAHLDKLLPAVIRLSAGGRFQKIPLLPRSAWEEAVLNAVLHRSYSLTGDYIRVEVFTDRLEVRSPGGLPGPVSIKDLEGNHFARNPHIGRVMTELQYARQLGEGIKRMVADTMKAGFPRPTFSEAGDVFTVTFLFDSAYAKILQLLPGADRFVNHLAASGGRFTTAEAQSLLGMTKPPVLNHLGKLEKAKIIGRVQQSKNDPRGYWQLRPRKR